MKDAKELLESNPIEILTIPSDKCAFKKCDGTGWYWVKDWSLRNLKTRDKVDEHGQVKKDEWLEKCECYDQLVKQREVNRILDLSNVPPIFHNATVASYRTEKYKKEESRQIAQIAKLAAVNYVNNFETMKKSGKGLYLYSHIKGSGKTRLASSIANALVKVHGVDLAFIKSADIISQVQNTFNKESKTTRASVIDTFRKVELLIIDDLAIKEATVFEEGIFYDILDDRLENNKLTIFTSNVTIDELEMTYPGGRVNKRVNKMAIQINLPEESIRDDEAESENAEFENILFKKGEKL